MHVNALVLPNQVQEVTGEFSKETTADKIVSLLSDLLQVMSYPVNLDRAQNRSRGTVAVESGTVTTVTTVTGLSNIDGYQGKIPVINLNLDAWANVVRRTIS